MELVFQNLEQKVENNYAYLTSFTTDRANKIVRNPGSQQGLEARRRLHAEFDPTSAMRRVLILGQVRTPDKVQKVEDLGTALEDCLEKRRQYESYTNSDGTQCTVTGDSMIAAMHKLALFTAQEEETFETL